jgi:hypothetical protein
MAIKDAGCRASKRGLTLDRPDGTVDIEQMLKMFRRQDRLTNWSLGAALIGCLAALAVWSWYYAQ